MKCANIFYSYFDVLVSQVIRYCYDDRGYQLCTANLSFLTDLLFLVDILDIPQVGFYQMHQEERSHLCSLIHQRPVCKEHTFHVLIPEMFGVLALLYQGISQRLVEVLETCGWYALVTQCSVPICSNKQSVTWLQNSWS